MTACRGTPTKLPACALRTATERDRSSHTLETFWDMKKRRYRDVHHKKLAGIENRNAKLLGNRLRRRSGRRDVQLAIQEILGRFDCPALRSPRDGDTPVRE